MLLNRCIVSLPKVRINRLLLAGYICLLPVQFKSAWGINIAPSDAIMMIFLLLNLSQIKIVPKSWSVWHLLIIFLYGLGTAVSVARIGILTRYVLWQKNVGLLVLYMGYLQITAFVSKPEDILWCLRWFLRAVSWFNLLALAAFFSNQAGLWNPDWLNYFNTRLSGMLLDPNAYGGLLVTALAINYFVRDETGRPLLKRGRLAGVMLVLGLVLTYSRSAWIGGAIVLLGGLILKGKQVLRLIALGGGIVSVLPVLFGRNYWGIFTVMASRPEQIAIRINTINEALGLFSSRPLFGIGLGIMFANSRWIVHNTLLWFLVEFGIAGLVVIVGFFCWFLRRGRRVWKCSKGLRPLAAGLMLSHVGMLGVSLGIEAFYQRHWWLIMALLAVLSRRVDWRGEDNGEWQGKEKGVFGQDIVSVQSVFTPLDRFRTAADEDVTEMGI